MRVLIISAFFPPLNNIASQRIGAFEKHLREFGMEVDVITRYYDSERAKGKSMFIHQDAASGITEPYIRKGNVVYTNYDTETREKKRFHRLPPGIRGLYAYMKIDVYAYGWMRYVMQAFQQEFSKNKYDGIIASYGPPVTLLAAKKIADQYKIPYFADYRDIFINEKDKGYHLSLKKKQQQFLLSKASGILFVSEGMKAFFHRHASARLKKIPTAIVMNGMDDQFFSGHETKTTHPVVEKIAALREKHDLLLLHTGTLYPDQNIGFFAEAIRAFNQQSKKTVAMVFVGFADDLRDRKPLEGENIYFFEKVDSGASIELQQLADGLILPVWEGRYTGFSGKLLEYMAVENLVLSGPNMQKDVVDFTQGFDNVIHLENAGDLKIRLEKMISGEFRRQKAKPGQLEKLKRSYWVKELARFMETHSNKTGVK